MPMPVPHTRRCDASACGKQSGLKFPYVEKPPPSLGCKNLFIFDGKETGNLWTWQTRPKIALSFFELLQKNSG